VKYFCDKVIFLWLTLGGKIKLARLAFRPKDFRCFVPAPRWQEKMMNTKDESRGNGSVKNTFNANIKWKRKHSQANVLCTHSLEPSVVLQGDQIGRFLPTWLLFTLCSFLKIKEEAQAFVLLFSAVKVMY
jgi:hypothetical protein